MARAAGNGRNYRIGVVDTQGNLVEEFAGFPSVTTIIGATDASKSDALMGWAYNEGMAGVAELLKRNELKPGMSAAAIKQRLKAAKLTPWSKRDKAATRGTDVHDLAEQLLLGKITYDDALEATDAEHVGYTRALIAWHQQYANEVIATERVMVSLKHQYAGTTDLIDKTPAGSVRVADFKTSKRIYPSQFVQGDAYALAWEEMTASMGNPMTVDEVVVIRFGSDGKYEEQTQAPNNGKVFLPMLALYRATN